MTGTTKQTARRRAGGNTLLILALLMAVSATLRLGEGVGIAVARAASGDESGTKELAAAPLDCPLPPLALAEALSAREAKVAARELVMEDRLAALRLADEAIEIRLIKLADAEASLNETLARADGASEADLTKLTEVYQSMKPKDAAALFATMAPEFAAGFLGRMRPESSAPILSGMSPENAYAISVLLAGRNANVPKE
jgi:flagellar motility protein MotE (MotC chaperone)